MDRRGTLVGLAFVCATVGVVSVTKMAEAEDGKKVPEVAYRLQVSMPVATAEKIVAAALQAGEEAR